jgi:hypothetical protein
MSRKQLTLLGVLVGGVLVLSAAFATIAHLSRAGRAALKAAPSTRHGPPVALLPMDLSHARLTPADGASIAEFLRSFLGSMLANRGYHLTVVRNAADPLAPNEVSVPAPCDLTCEQDASRRVGADYFLAGAVETHGDVTTGMLRLYAAASGRELSSVDLRGSTASELIVGVKNGWQRLLNALPAPVRP